MNRHSTVSVFSIVAVGLALLFSQQTPFYRAQPTASSSAAQGASASPIERVGYPTFASPHARPIVVDGDRVFVVNTPSDTVDVIDVTSRKIVKRINVGVDPVSLALRPDGKEVWVSNHVSDSVNVINNDSTSSSYLSIVATIQEFDPETKATRFDEPVGIAFAGNDKAYVALSSENQIAVIDTESRVVTKRLTIPAQDPRAIAVHGDRLYVIPFESNNQTQLSGGSGDEIDGDLVTFDAWQHSIVHNNVLSIGHVVDIVKHPEVPDRDLFVFDTKTDQLIESVDTLGTLLYGITVDSKGNVFVAQTDARNDINGRAGSKKHGMAELENRAFLNRITRVDFSGDAAETTFLDLEPLPPNQPTKESALATPFAVEVSRDDSMLVATAAGSDKLFTLDTSTGEVSGRISVGAVPRGVALQHSPGGDAEFAWVFNAVANTVSVVRVSDPNDLEVVGFVPLADPTERQVKLGRTWFNDAKASSTGTYSCASCHPDGHTDQLLWVLKTPVVSGGDQIMPRSTMPIRGLRDTAPFHWDGIPGDPYGGNNSANVHGSDPPNSDVNDPTSSTRHLIDGGLANTMLLAGDPTINDEGQPGAFSAAERDDMAKFLLCVPYPPAQKRPFTNVVSDRAVKGFELFHISGHHDEKPKPNVCGDCHRMPFLVSTNTPGTGMDAPTWRGANDRFLILPQGRLNLVEFDFYRRVAERGIPEREVWQFSWQGQPRFDPIWDMVLEGSTGFSGTFARQVTLNAKNVDRDLTTELIDAMELAAREKAVVLEVDGVLNGQDESREVNLQFRHSGGTDVYVSKIDDGFKMTREELVSSAADGDLVATFTARHGHKVDPVHPQPAIWTRGPIEQQRGHQQFPILFDGNPEMTVSGRHIGDDARIFVDGRWVSGSVALVEPEVIRIGLDVLPEEGIHLLQLQNPAGRFSNDFLFDVVATEQDAGRLRDRRRREDMDIRDAIAQAITDDNAAEVRRHLNRRQQARRVNERQPSSGSTPLSHAAMHGRSEIVNLLLRRGADVNGTNRDGNTPLHLAAFFCHAELVELLLEKGAAVDRKNRRGEKPVDIVSSEWNEELAGFYEGIGRAIGRKMDPERLQRDRPKIAEMLRESAKSE